MEPYRMIDRAQSARRIEHDIETLATGKYTTTPSAICRYAYTQEYLETLAYFRRALQRLGFSVSEDPVGNFIARNRPAGVPVCGIGSHCDSNRNGGKYDGTLGVVTALEVCRLNAEHDLDIPLQLISFMEEEASGFGVSLLGSRIAAGRISEDELRTLRAVDDGRSFWEHAKEAGYKPECWKQSRAMLRDLFGWLELHIEQGRVLQDRGKRIGIVTGIAGMAWIEVVIQGREDHAGATPMNCRLDAGVAAAECVVALERIACRIGADTVATVGELELSPNVVNVVPGRARMRMDIRSLRDESVEGVISEIKTYLANTVAARDLSAIVNHETQLPATEMDERVVRVLQHATEASGEPHMLMPSGAAHDTVCVADHVPSGMLFVPCREGISHSPLEKADSDDAAIGAEVILNTIGNLAASNLGNGE